MGKFSTEVSKQLPGSKNRPYEVVEYDNNWPLLYEQYAQKIKSIFGEELLEIHHFGSTSIPGMFAKPNIDIYVVVKDLARIKELYSQMETGGYTYHGDYCKIGEEYFTLDTELGERIASIHVFDSPTVTIGYKNFRDYLEEFPEERGRYIALKKELFEKYRDDYRSYDSGKKELIDELKAKANEWAGKKIVS